MSSSACSFQQIERGLFRYPSRGLWRAFYRLPLLGWRAGLVPLLTPLRILVLTTRGRKTGRPRHTMVECTMLNAAAYIALGWGKRTQWYRNILAIPHVTVQRSRTPYGAIARRVNDEADWQTFIAQHGHRARFGSSILPSSASRTGSRTFLPSANA